MSQTPTPEQLQMIKTWLATEPNAPKHFTKAGNEIARRHLDWCVRFTAKALGEPSGDIGRVLPTHHVDFDTEDGKFIAKKIFEQLCKEVADE